MVINNERYVYPSKRKKIINIKKIFLYFLIFLWLIIFFVNSTGLYPKIDINYFRDIIILISFFVVVLYFEKLKGKFTEKDILRIFYIAFIIIISIINFSGGIKSLSKWMLIIFILLTAYHKMIKHSLIFTVTSFLCFIKQIKNFTADDFFIFVFSFIIILFFYVVYEFQGKEENIELSTGIEKDVRDFKTQVYNLLFNYLKIYHSILNPVSILFFIKSNKKEGIFEILTFNSGYPEFIDKKFQIDINEDILGATIKNNDFFIMDVKYVKIPYYIKPVQDIKKMVIKKIVKDRIIGALIADFNIDVIKADFIKEKMTNLSEEILNILKIFELGNYVVNKEKQLSKLYDIYEQLNILEGKTKVMHNFLDKIKTFDIESGYIAEFDYEKNKFIVGENFGYPLNITGNEISIEDDEILNYICASKKNLIIENVLQKNIFLNFNNENIDSFFVGLLRKKNSFYGLIKLDKKTGKKFNDFEIKTIEALLSGITILFENAELYENMTKQATLDGLTQILNHITFEKKLRESLEKCDRRELSCVSVILSDIDNFKSFNDTFGHQEGDKVLKKVALLLKEFEKKYEGTYAARYGGEEFIFILENYDIFKANKVAEEIRSNCEQNLQGGNEKEKRKITLSIGVCTYPDYAKTMRDLIKNADEFLYLAKKQGKNRVKSILEEKGMG